MTRMILFLLWFLVSGAAGAFAADSATGFASDAPIEVTSRRMEAFSAPRRVHFAEEVVAKQGNAVIYADDLTVYFAGEEQEVERIEVEGNVRIVQEDRIATGGKGVFRRSEGIIVLTDSPRVRQGADFVEGDEITIFLNEERSVVKSEGGSQVRAVFHPKDGKP